MQKRIIIGLPTIHEIGALLMENLEYLGFEVIDISYSQNGFVYKNVLQRMVNLFHKTVLNDKSYKDRLRFAIHQPIIVEKLNLLKERVDYALIIRPDAYAAEVLQLIKSKTNKMVGYQWDGLSRFPWVEKSIPQFDRFFVFDPMDLKTKGPKREYLGNFYFSLPRLLNHEKAIQTVAYFVGHYSDERAQLLQRLVALLKTVETPTEFILNTKDSKLQKLHLPGIKIGPFAFSYEKNLERVKYAKVLIDITAPCHKGLSLRFYEAICFEKKIITTNSDVLYYDFYQKENIFIYGVDDEKQLAGFMASPYHPLDINICKKYEFDNWIRFMFDIPPHIKIEPPMGIEAPLGGVSIPIVSDQQLVAN